MRKNGVKIEKKMKRMVVSCLHLRLRPHPRPSLPESYRQIRLEKVVVLEVDRLG